MTMVLRLLRLFPRAWRARYEDEVRALLDDSGRSSGRDLLDLARACVDAWSVDAQRTISSPAKRVWSSGLKLAVVFAVGYATVGIVEVAASSTPIAGFLGSVQGRWIDHLVGLRFALMIAVWLFVAQPYLDSENEKFRPSRTQVAGWLSAFAILLALDTESSHGADGLWFGLIATMRHSAALRIRDPQRRRVPTNPLGVNQGESR